MLDTLIMMKHKALNETKNDNEIDNGVIVPSPKSTIETFMLMPAIKLAVLKENHCVDLFIVLFVLLYSSFILDLCLQYVVFDSYVKTHFEVFLRSALQSLSDFTFKPVDKCSVCFCYSQDEPAI